MFHSISDKTRTGNALKWRNVANRVTASASTQPNSELWLEAAKTACATASAWGGNLSEAYAAVEEATVHFRRTKELFANLSAKSDCRTALSIATSAWRSSLRAVASVDQSCVDDDPAIVGLPAVESALTRAFRLPDRPALLRNPAR